MPPKSKPGKAPRLEYGPRVQTSISIETGLLRRSQAQARREGASFSSWVEEVLRECYEAEQRAGKRKGGGKMGARRADPEE